MTSAKPKSRPTFDQLGSEPYKNAWGLYGADDEIGTLNLLTNEAISGAAREVEDGVSIGLNLPLGQPVAPFNPTRCRVTHKIIAKGYANDDELHLNTQSSSQWDGLRHFPYQDGLKFYNGATQDDFTGPNAGTKLGIQSMAETGIVARGVLLDFWSYAQAHGIEYDPLAGFRITVEHLEAVARAQGVQWKTGDIMLVRSGVTAAYRALSLDVQEGMGDGNHKTFAGVEQSEAMLRWHWDHAFAAVGGDTYAYEAWPAAVAPGDPMRVRFCHEVFLSGWGMPLGEILDLERLADECKRRNKWTFMLASAPLNVPGGVASIANLVAIL